MGLGSKSAEPVVVASVQSGGVEQRVEIEGEPVLFAGHVEIVAVAADGVLL